MTLSSRDSLNLATKYVIFLDVLVCTQSGFSLQPVSAESSHVFIGFIVVPFLMMLTLSLGFMQKPFFSNFGAIVTFSVLGTFVASIVTGVLVYVSLSCEWLLFFYGEGPLYITHKFFFCWRYLGGVMFLMYRLPFVECLMFGSLISATDPVTVLSIFQVLPFTALWGDSQFSEQ